MNVGAREASKFAAASARFERERGGRQSAPFCNVGFFQPACREAFASHELNASPSFSSFFFCLLFLFYSLFFCLSSYVFLLLLSYFCPFYVAFFVSRLDPLLLCEVHCDQLPA